MPSGKPGTNPTVEFQNYMAVLSIAGGPSYLDPVQKLVAQLRQREVVGMVTLATPNSATLTYGQIAGWMKMSAVATTLGFPNKTASFVDLTTDRLFRILQSFRTNTPTLSVSGSAHNRFSKKRPALGVLVGLAGKLALPNDGLVETDRSISRLRSCQTRFVTWALANTFICASIPTALTFSIRVSMMKWPSMMLWLRSFKEFFESDVRRLPAMALIKQRVCLTK